MIQSLIDRNLLPDFIIRLGIRRLNKQRLREELPPTGEEQKAKLMAFIEESRNFPIAIATEEANDQHYELPPKFFEMVLGEHLKYSSCYWKTGTRTLDKAEADMLELSTKRAQIGENQEILEIGCGWGSLTLFMAAKFKNSKVTAVSNSHSQREFIMNRAKERGLDNVEVITCDINDLKLDRKFDRIVSVEMFEHARNYSRLFDLMNEHLRPGGKMFIHVFTHRSMPYYFEQSQKQKSSDDFMARYFFTQGTMPSNELFLYHAGGLALDKQWVVNGRHYGKTARAWLDNMDKKRKELMPVLGGTYGQENAKKWFGYWRIFFMACEELFNTSRGEEWMVCHYLFSKPDKAPA